MDLLDWEPTSVWNQGISLDLLWRSTIRSCISAYSQGTMTGVAMCPVPGWNDSQEEGEIECNGKRRKIMSTDVREILIAEDDEMTRKVFGEIIKRYFTRIGGNGQKTAFKI